MPVRSQSSRTSGYLRKFHYRLGFNDSAEKIFITKIPPRSFSYIREDIITSVLETDGFTVLLRVQTQNSPQLNVLDVMFHNFHSFETVGIQKNEHQINVYQLPADRFKCLRARCRDTILASLHKNKEHLLPLPKILTILDFVIGEIPKSLSDDMYIVSSHYHLLSVLIESWNEQRCVHIYLALNDRDRISVCIQD